MCGIVGAVSQRDVVNILIDGLKKLEYRGYDSTGLATLDSNGDISRYRKSGKVKALEALIKEQSLPIEGKMGIAHTRWATHGKPTDENSHPHVSNCIALVHNGIIENHLALKKMLLDKGYQFTSQTDSEVIAHLVDLNLTQSDDLLSAVKQTVSQLEGAYSIAVIQKNTPDHLVIARSGSPLVIGVGIDENFIGSDQLALLSVTNRFIFLEEGDIAELTPKSIHIYDKNNEPVERIIHESSLKNDHASKGEYRHFMQKEIFEQPQVAIDTIKSKITGNQLNPNNFNNEQVKLLTSAQHIKIVACGTSYNAGLVAKYWFEQLAQISCDVEIASEFRYRESICLPNSLFITISQSGETADTLSALKKAKSQGYMATATICNVDESSIVRESDFCMMTNAGTEIGVASTKAFTSQLSALLILITTLGKLKKTVGTNQEEAIISALRSLPNAINQALLLNDNIKVLSEDFADKNHTLFLGRGEFYPIAMEAALKLKEISYIHAEAYAAGELKHGPLALIDENMPVVVVAPNNRLLEKLKSNIEEVSARGGKLYVFTNKEANFKNDDNVTVIPLPFVDDYIAPIFYTIPMQLLSYHVALIKGTDVDQPRNLAKSVTVE